MSDTNKSEIPPVSEAYGGGDGGPNGMGIAKPDTKSTDEQAPTKEAVLKASEDFHAIPLSMVADADKPTEEKAPEKLNPALTGQDMLQPKRQTFVKPNEDLAALDAL